MRLHNLASQKSRPFGRECCSVYLGWNDGQLDWSDDWLCPEVDAGQADGLVDDGEGPVLAGRLLLHPPSGAPSSSKSSRTKPTKPTKPTNRTKKRKNNNKQNRDEARWHIFPIFWHIFSQQWKTRENREEGGINRLQYCLVNTPRHGTILPFAHHWFCPLRVFLLCRWC